MTASASSTARGRDRSLPPSWSGPAGRRAVDLINRLAARPDVVVCTIAFTVLAALYTTLALLQHRMLMTSGFDLGIFEQEVRSYAAGQLPTSTLKGPDFALLGDHFSPIVASLAPVYLMFPNAQTLLVAQALLLAAGVVPLARWAHCACGTQVAVVIAVVYGLSWQVAEAIGFDFHEVAFAVPLLAWSLTALGQQRLRAAVLYAAPLILVKEDLGLTVAMIGAVVAWRGSRLFGSAAMIGGVAATALETYVLIPAFNDDRTNDYTGQITFAGGPWHLVTTIVSSDVRLSTLFLLLIPTPFFALRSSLVLVAVPTLLWRFAADNPAYWGSTYHYSVVLAPIMIAAMIEALAMSDRRTRAWASIAGLVATIALLSPHPFSRLWQGDLWHATARVEAADRLLAKIPDDTTVSASNWLVPHLTNRADVSLFGYTPLDQSHATWVIVDTGSPQSFPIGPDEQVKEINAALRLEYRLVAQEHGIYLLRSLR